MMTYYNDTKNVIEELSDLLLKVNQKEIELYIDHLLKAHSIFFVGVGRVKLSLESTIKRYTHLDLDCHMVGDLNEPPIKKEDLLVVGSGSGESLFPLGIANKAKGYGVKIVHLTSNPDSSIGKLANVIVRFESPSKANQSVESIQPMTTSFEQGLLLFHDILTLEIMREKNLSFNDLIKKHANLE